MKTAFIFPGQGAQVVGMGMDLAMDFPEAAQTQQEPAAETPANSRCRYQTSHPRKKETAPSHHAEVP